MVVCAAAAAVSVSARRKEKGQGMCVRFIPFASIHFIFGRQTRKVTPKRKNRNRLLGALQRKAERKSKIHRKKTLHLRGRAAFVSVYDRFACVFMYVCECSCKACYLIFGVFLLALLSSVYIW